jgi:hypothetical protein
VVRPGFRAAMFGPPHEDRGGRPAGSGVVRRCPFSGLNSGPQVEPFVGALGKPSFDKVSRSWSNRKGPPGAIFDYPQRRSLLADEGRLFVQRSEPGDGAAMPRNAPWDAEPRHPRGLSYVVRTGSLMAVHFLSPDRLRGERKADRRPH